MRDVQSRNVYRADDGEGADGLEEGGRHGLERLGALALPVPDPNATAPVHV